MLSCFKNKKSIIFVNLFENTSSTGKETKKGGHKDSTGNFCNFDNFLGRNFHYDFLKGTSLKYRNRVGLWTGEVAFT